MLTNLADVPAQVNLYEVLKNHTSGNGRAAACLEALQAELRHYGQFTERWPRLGDLILRWPAWEDAQAEPDMVRRSPVTLWWLGLFWQGYARRACQALGVDFKEGMGKHTLTAIVLAAADVADIGLRDSLGLVGLGLPAARALAAAKGYTLHVRKLEGIPFGPGRVCNPARVNVVVEQGRVSELLTFG